MLNYRITILALLLLSAQAFSQTPEPTTPPVSSTESATPTVQTTESVTTPPPATTTKPPTTTPTDTVPATSVPATPVQDSTTTTPVPVPETLKVPQNPESVNCEFHIPKEKQVSDELVSVWAKKAAIQSFTFTPQALDSELEKLKLCFTNEGWKSFQDALQQSGNLEAIKTQKLNVISLADGELKLSKNQDNQWKATIPMQITYQNEKDKLIQKLVIDLLISRKDNGDLGIIQVIATVRSADDAANKK